MSLLLRINVIVHQWIQCQLCMKHFYYYDIHLETIIKFQLLCHTFRCSESKCSTVHVIIKNYDKCPISKFWLTLLDQILNTLQLRLLHPPESPWSCKCGGHQTYYSPIYVQSKVTLRQNPYDGRCNHSLSSEPCKSGYFWITAILLTAPLLYWCYEVRQGNDCFTSSFIQIHK